MSELARNIASRLRHYIGDRRRAERCPANLPVEVFLLNGPDRSEAIQGHTVDISTTGVAIIVPVIRIGDHYLAGENQKLLLKVRLPESVVEIHVTPVRYERLDETESELGYLIGVSITSMSDEDRQIYDTHVGSLLQR
ncbi:MAG TPA: PilZ domain-containing protein [Pyrinomonadaceae bacterium]|nr:PilZ domain-containing protein [Pyrinomonadaceae bacterium]